MINKDTYPFLISDDEDSDMNEDINMFPLDFDNDSQPFPSPFDFECFDLKTTNQQIKRQNQNQNPKLSIFGFDSYLQTAKCLLDINLKSFIRNFEHYLNYYVNSQREYCYYYLHYSFALVLDYNSKKDDYLLMI